MAKATLCYIQGWARMLFLWGLDSMRRKEGEMQMMDSGKVMERISLASNGEIHCMQPVPSAQLTGGQLHAASIGRQASRQLQRQSYVKLQLGQVGPGDVLTAVSIFPQIPGGGPVYSSSTLSLKTDWLWSINVWTLSTLSVAGGYRYPPWDVAPLTVAMHLLFVETSLQCFFSWSNDL